MSVDDYIAHYEIQALAHGQTGPRLLNFFAQLDLGPSKFAMKARGDWLEVTIKQPALLKEQAEIIAEKMRVCVLVASVSLRYFCGSNNCNGKSRR